MDHDRCRIAYKTYIDDKISLAEVEFVNGDWKMATDIEVFQRAMVGSNFALTYDALSDDKVCVVCYQASKRGVRGTCRLTWGKNFYI